MARDAAGPRPFQLLIYPATDLSPDRTSDRDNALDVLPADEARRWSYFRDHYLPRPED